MLGLGLYQFLKRYQAFFIHVYNFLRRRLAATRAPTLSSVHSPLVEAFVVARSLEGDTDDRALELLYEVGGELRRVLCVRPSARNIQALYMLSKAGAEITCVACPEYQGNLQEYGFAVTQEDFGQWMITTDQTTLTHYDGLLLDAQIEERILLLLKGRLWPKTKIVINSGASHDNRLRLALGSPQREISGLAIYDTPPESWLDPCYRNPTFYTETGWPWEAQSVEIPPALPSGRPWPKISIVTVTLNQGAYLEETLLSVLLQGYPNLEYIVLDRSSTDSTSHILERYRAELAYCSSEKDNGLADALNKGFHVATGHILAWLKSGDLYLPGTLLRVALAFDKYAADLVAGGCGIVQGDSLAILHTHHNALPVGRVVSLPLGRLLDVNGSWQRKEFFYQPEVFVGHTIWERAGGRVAEDLPHNMDYELWLRMALHRARIVHIPDTLALFRLHKGQKTSGSDRPLLAELRRVSARFQKELTNDEPGRS